MSFYDDNYGTWDGMNSSDPDFEDNLEFYNQVQRESVVKVCRQCNREVKIRQQYEICNSCADANEHGAGFISYADY